MSRRAAAGVLFALSLGLAGWWQAQCVTGTAASTWTGALVVPTALWVPSISGTVTRILLSNGATSSFALASNPSYCGWDGKKVWVTQQGASTVSVYTSTSTLFGTFTINGAAAMGVAVNQLSDSAWVTSYTTGNITRLRVLDGANGGSVTSSVSSYQAIIAGSTVWAGYAIPGTYITRLVPGLSVITSTPAGTNPVPSQLTSDSSSNVWMANTVSSTMSKYNGFTGALIASYNTTSTNPSCIAYDLTTESIWVTFSTTKVAKFKATDGSYVGAYTTGSASYGVVSDGLGHIWTANNTGASVTELNASDGSLVGTYTVAAQPYVPCVGQ